MTGVDPAVESLAEAICRAAHPHRWTSAVRPEWPCKGCQTVAASGAVTLTAGPCSTCGGRGVVPEEHDGGTHPVHCPEGCDLPGVTLAADREHHDTARADHYQYLYEAASEGRCGHSGLPLPRCKRSICDCFDFPWVAADREPGLRAAIEALRSAFSGDEFEENAAAAAGEGEWSWFRWLAVTTIEGLAAHPATDQPEVDRG